MRSVRWCCDDPAAFKDADEHLHSIERVKTMIGDIYIRTIKASEAKKALEDAYKQRREIKAARFKDASEKQRKAVPSKKSKLKRTIARLKKENRARDI
jgi:hypothetical protein